MPEVLVANASPLIFLSLVDGLGWLERLSSGLVIVPEAVLAEISAGDDGQKLAEDIRAIEWMKPYPEMVVPNEVSSWDLGAGESQVLAVCLGHSNARAVLDDSAARNCSRSLGKAVVGTLGIVLIAKKRGWIRVARPIITSLVARGMYLSTSLIESALEVVGE